MIEPELLSDIWTTCKEYIPAKDRQSAADHVISIASDSGISDQDIKAFGGTDAFLKRAVTEYLGDEDDEAYDDDDLMTDY